MSKEEESHTVQEGLGCYYGRFFQGKEALCIFFPYRSRYKELHI